MVRVLLSLGIIAAIAGLMAVGFGIPIQAFGLGNTLILAGSTIFSAGLIVVALSMVLRAIDQVSQELRRPGTLEPGGSHASFEHQPVAATIARQVAPPPTPEWPPAPLPARDDAAYAERPEPRRAPVPPRSGWQDDGAVEPAAPSSVRPPGAPPARPEREPVPPPRLEREAALRPRSPGRPERPAREPALERPQQAPEAERRREPVVPATQRDERSEEPRIDPYAPPERRRVFGWTRRSKDRREDTGASAEREGEAPFGAPAGSAAAGRAHPAPADSRDMSRAPVRGPAPAEPRERPASHGTPAGRGDQAQPVEVLKQGTVDGMAYTLYTDGSIDAEFPEGRIRFDSIEDLRQHLEAQG